jgi:ABC-type Fe3+/spermidine/putrescine transport system ATPase subunit
VRDEEACPQSLDTIVMKLLAPRAEDRYPTGRDVAAAIGRAMLIKQELVDAATLEATIADGDRGEVEHGGTRVAVDAARGRRRGEPVLLLVRPETVELSAAGVDGDDLIGEVLSHTFLGAVTRIKVLAGDAEWSADLSVESASVLPVGSRVSVRFPAASAQLLSLAESGASPAARPDDR